MIDPDAQPVARCKRGDREALELLFRRYVDRVWRYGWSVTRSRESAAEIVQETFLRVANSIGSFEGRSTFATWLFTLTRSATMEFLRRERQETRRRADANVLRLITTDEVREVRREVRLPARSADDVLAAVSDSRIARPNDADRDATREAIHKAIAELSGAQRDTVILCELVGMSIAEATEVLGWGESRTKVTLFRARRRLRELLCGQTAVETDAKRAEET
ncbi:MAG: RNA polymerase sigma factor [Planctomycetes bacterium]|nr:RNA polymerase sigma factor [Planctomycetota bacterium]MBI3833005.1 RNA polymerase sigma factor [Planctomycetota bacterium]